MLRNVDASTLVMVIWLLNNLFIVRRGLEKFTRFAESPG